MQHWIELEDKEVLVDVEIITSTEHNYGADADGNRGIYAKFLEDWHWKSETKLTEEENAIVETEVERIAERMFEDGND
jgi:hypothetical protein